MNEQHRLAAYVSDMLALEEHIHVPLTTQASDGDLAEYPGAAGILTRTEALCETHAQALKSCLQALGGHELAGAKSAVTNIEGWFASAIDMLRKTKIAKALRDDYTALALCCVSYSMLYTAANALGDDRVAQLALRHLRDYTVVVNEIGDIMPVIVVQDLQESGAAADASIIESSRAAIADAWSSAARAQRQLHTGTIEADAAANRRASPTYPTA